MTTSPGPTRTPRPRRAATLAGLLGVALALTSCTPAPGPGAPSGSQAPGTTPAPGSASHGTGGAGPGEEPEPSELELALGGPSVEMEEAAAAAVAEMDTAERAGQVLVGELGAPGTDPDSIRSLNLGGVIVMGDAVPIGDDGLADLNALEAEIARTQEALSDGRDWSGIVSVDQEGGLVARVKAPLAEWPTPMAYGAVAAGEAAAGESAAGESAGGEGANDAATGLAFRGHREMAGQLAELGFTLDFAPSVDVTIGAEDPAIGARSFSSDPATVAGLGRAAAAGLLSVGVLPAPKHFPGHGSVTDDSHVTAPVQEASLDELGERDWLPFRALMSDASLYTPMVMMGHLVVPALEPEVPSSVSPAAYEALRELALPAGNAGGDTAGGAYDGVVVTDALNMGALVERYGPREVPVKALAAGADLLLMPSDLTGARDAIVAAVEDGTVPAERLAEAAERVVTLLTWRDHLAGALERASEAEKAAAGVGTGEGTGAGEAGEQDPELTARELSAAAVTVVQGRCGAPYVQDGLQVTGGTERDRARLAEAARAAGLHVGTGPVVHLLGGAREAGQGHVVVALDAPFGLARSVVPDDGALVALYGRNPGAFAALVTVLTGDAEAPGALPVQVGEWPAGTGC